MAAGGRRRRIWTLVVVGLALAALVALYATTPSPTVLLVHAVDREAGLSLPGAIVTVAVAGSEPPRPVTTDESGIARLELSEGHPAYRVQVQKVDYARAVVAGVDVPAEQETELVVALDARPGQRLYVGLEDARITEIDGASLTVVQTVIVPGAPEAPVRCLRLHPAEDLLYTVAGARGYIVSARTGAVLTPFDVDLASVDSLEVSADGRHVLVTGVADVDTTGVLEQQRLWFLDARSGRVVSDTLLSDRVSVDILWQPDGIDPYLLFATSPDFRDLVASTRMLGPLSTVALRSSRYPNRVNVSPDRAYLYTWLANRFSPERNEFVDSLLMASMEDGASLSQDVSRGVSALAISPVKEEIYMLNAALGTLTIIDLTGARRQLVVPVGKQPAVLVVSGDGTRVYVADEVGASVFAIDVESARVVESIPLPGTPLALAVR